VTLLSLDQFVGEKTLSGAVWQLQKRGFGELTPNAKDTADLIVAQIHDSRASTEKEEAPWLVLIDDNPNYVTELVSYAEDNGISVFQFFSTASAKVWIDANEGQ
jgi:hypothetical protein